MTAAFTTGCQSAVGDMTPRIITPMVAARRNEYTVARQTHRAAVFACRVALSCADGCNATAPISGNAIPTIVAPTMTSAMTGSIIHSSDPAGMTSAGPRTLIHMRPHESDPSRIDAASAYSPPLPRISVTACANAACLPFLKSSQSRVRW